MEKLRFPVKKAEFHRQELDFTWNDKALTNKFKRAQTHTMYGSYQPT